MPTPTYTPLANLTLSSSAASVTFSSISQAYRDLVLVSSANTVSGGATFMLGRLNGDTGSNYSFVRASGNGTDVDSTSGTNTFIFFDNLGSLATTGRNDTLINLMDYSATDKHASLLIRSNNATIGGVEMRATRWASTSAVTTFLLYPSGGNIFASGSTFALYGIAA